MTLAEVHNMFEALAASQRGGRMVSDEEWENFERECEALGIRA